MTLGTMPLGDLLADHVAEAALVDALTVTPWREVSTPAQEHARAERQREATRQALAILARERSGEAVRPPFAGPLQALRALDAWRMDGPSVPGTPVWSRLDEHDTGRGESVPSCVERLADVAAAWEACLADGWTISTSPVVLRLSAPQARAVVVWATLGVGGLAPLQQDQRGLTREAWRTERQTRRKIAFRGGFEAPEHGGGWSRYCEPQAPAIAEYASEQFGVTLPVGHVLRLRTRGIGELYARMVGCGLIPRSERMARMSEATGLERLDLHGWKDIRPVFPKPGGGEWDERVLRAWAERADDPLPLHVVGGQVAACRADLAAWSAREFERTRRKPRAVAAR